MTLLHIIGAGGHGKVVADIARALGYTEISFLDNAWPQKTKNGAWDVVGQPTASQTPTFCAVGNNAVREKLFSDLDLRDVPILIHPSAIVSTDTHIDEGTAIVAGAIINPDARIGRGVILNTACSVDHDCVVGDFAHISPGARLAGGVTVGKRSWIGIGAVVREGIHIGDDVIVGAGSVVVENIENGAKVCGVPARIMQ